MHGAATPPTFRHKVTAQSAQALPFAASVAASSVGYIGAEREAANDREPAQPHDQRPGVALPPEPLLLPPHLRAPGQLAHLASTRDKGCCARRAGRREKWAGGSPGWPWPCATATAPSDTQCVCPPRWPPAPARCDPPRRTQRRRCSDPCSRGCASRSETRNQPRRPDQTRDTGAHWPPGRMSPAYLRPSAWTHSRWQTDRSSE